MVNSRSFICTYYPQPGEKIDWEDVFKRTKGLKALAGQLEVCPTTLREHWQFFLQFDQPTTEAQCGKRTGIVISKAIAKTYGKDEDMFNYGQKDNTAVPGTRFVYGALSKGQGERTDLKQIKDDIMDGKELDDIILENPMMYHKYGRTMERVETIRLKKNKRTEMTRGLWLHGKTGVGKSKLAFTYDENAYTWVNGCKFQCGYKQQETVIINEFRGEMTLAELLNMVDRNTFMVERKGKEAIPFTSKLVIITSSKSPREVYQHAFSVSESYEQIKRRFIIHEVLINNTDTVVKLLNNESS